MNYRPFLYALLALVVLFAIFGALRSRRTIKAAEEQAVILKLKLGSGQMGSDEERQRIHDLKTAWRIPSSGLLQEILMEMNTAMATARSTCMVRVQKLCFEPLNLS